MENDKENNFSESLLLLGRALTDALEKLNAWWQKPETQETLLKLANLPVQMEERLKAQRTYFRRGVLPSRPIVALADEFATVDAKTIAEEYAAALESHACFEDANLFREIAQVAALDRPIHTLRVIFPEIEAVARRDFYAPEVSEGITSLVEMRIAIGELLTEAPLGIAAEILAIERFTLVNLLAIDFAYKRTGDKSSRGSRIFAKVPNRHRVCHGIPGEYGRIHVINALTLLYMSVIVGRFMVKCGARLSTGQKDVHQTLNQQRDEQRGVNREMLLFIQELNRQSPALSENE